MNNPIIVPATVATDKVTFEASLAAFSQEMTASVETEIRYVRGRLQDKEFVPGEEDVLISADEDFDALNTVKIKAIPSNYGRISWNGSVLTVY